MGLPQVQQELIDDEKKVSLMDVIIKVTKELEDVTIYPYEKLRWVVPIKSSLSYCLTINNF